MKIDRRTMLKTAAAALVAAGPTRTVDKINRRRLRILAVSRELFDVLVCQALKDPPASAPRNDKGWAVLLPANEAEGFDWRWLAEAMHLPDGTEIDAVSMQMYFDRDEVAVRLRHPSFSPVAPGNTIPPVKVEYESEYHYRWVPENYRTEPVGGGPTIRSRYVS